MPAKPTIPAIPRQRRPDGPTAVATAAIPVVVVADPSTVGTLGGEVRADAAAETVAPVDTRGLEFIVTLPQISNDPDAVVGGAEEPPVTAEYETVDGELMPDDEAAQVGERIPGDDSPTVADYVAPAFAIVTEDVPDDDGDAYRGSRRRVAPWRRYPVGAVAVAVLLLLITGAVVFQWASGEDGGRNRNGGLPGGVPGVDLPGPPAPVAGAVDSPSPSAPASPSASPTASRSRAAAASATVTAAAGSPSPSLVVASTTTSSPAAPPPPVAQPTTGRLVGVGSNKCLEYRSGSQYRVVLDNCTTDGNQRWRTTGDVNTGAALVADDGRCLDVQNAGTGNGNAIQTYGCNGTPAQRWVRRKSGAGYLWVNPNSNRCLDAANGGTGAGTPLIIWDCSGAANQLWNMQA